MDKLTLRTITGLPPYALGTLCDLKKIRMGQAARVAYERRAEREGAFPFSGEIVERVKNPQLAATLLGACSPSILGPALTELKGMIYYTEVEPRVLELLRKSASEEPSFAFDSAEVEKAIGFNRDLGRDILEEVEDPFASAFKSLGVDLFDPYGQDFSAQDCISCFQTTGDEQYLIWAVREHIRASAGEVAAVHEIKEYLDLFTGTGEWGSRNFSAVALLRMNPELAVLAYQRGQWLCRKFGLQHKEVLMSYVSLPLEGLSGKLTLFIRDFV